MIRIPKSGSTSEPGRQSFALATPATFCPTFTECTTPVRPIATIRSSSRSSKTRNNCLSFNKMDRSLGRTPDMELSISATDRSKYKSYFPDSQQATINAN